MNFSFCLIRIFFFYHGQIGDGSPEFALNVFLDLLHTGGIEGVVFGRGFVTD